jgi:hypothetical protein
MMLVFPLLTFFTARFYVLPGSLRARPAGRPLLSQR